MENNYICVLKLYVMKSKVLLFVISALLIGVSAAAVERQGKEIYLDLMEEAARTCLYG